MPQDPALLSQQIGRPMDQSLVRRAQMFSPDLPWCNSDPNRLGPVIMQFVRDHESFYRRWAETWFQNFQFIFGNHDLKWSRELGFAVDYDFLRRGAGSFSLKAQTNIARVVAEALASLIYAQLPEWDVDSMSESHVKGKRFAKIVEKLLDCYMQRLNMDRNFAVAALIYVVFGQVASKVDWDFMGGKLLEVPMQRKVQAPVFTTYMAPNPMTGGLLEVPVQARDAMGQPMTEERIEQVVDQMGRAVINKIFAGDTYCKIRTPFEYRRALGSTGMHDTKWVQDVQVMDFDDYLDQYGQMPGKTKLFDAVRPTYNDPDIHALMVKQFMRLMFTTPPQADDRRAPSIVKSQLFKYKVLVVEHYDRPHPVKWPMGRKVVVCNGMATHVTTPTYNTNKLDGWHPFTEAQWMTIAPSSIASGPMNDVIRKNREMDVKDSLVATAVRRNMGSQLLIKTGSGINPQSLTGEPGAAHEVNDVNGVRWLHDDMPLPNVLPNLREMDKQDIYDTSGAGDALRGEPSTGASSGYQEKQREEREEKRLSPARKNWEQFVAGTGEKIWSCTKTNTVRLGDDVIGYLRRAAAGEFSVRDAIAMLSSSVDFGVDIKVTKSSMAVKSKATEQATMVELMGGPFAQRVQSDAKVLDKVAEEFGVEVLRDSSSVHRDRAARENEVFGDMLRLGQDTEGVKKPVVVFEDDDKIHMQDHSEWFVQNLEEILSNEQLLFEFLMHQETHRIQDQEKGAQVMPGTALQVPNMMAAARGQPTPTSQMIQQDAMMKAQTQQQQPAGPGAADGAAPQSPQTPTGAPGGGKSPNPQAPSGTTPGAKSVASQGGAPSDSAA